MISFQKKFLLLLIILLFSCAYADQKDHGIQIGILVSRGPYHPGQKLRVEIKVKNIGKESRYLYKNGIRLHLLDSEGKEPNVSLDIQYSPPLPDKADDFMLLAPQQEYVLDLEAKITVQEISLRSNQPNGQPYKVKGVFFIDCPDCYRILEKDGIYRLFASYSNNSHAGYYSGNPSGKSSGVAKNYVNIDALFGNIQSNIAEIDISGIKENK